MSFFKSFLSFQRKSVVLLLFFSLSVSFLKAQEIEDSLATFLNQEWYLTKLVIDQEEKPFIPSDMILKLYLNNDYIEVYDDKLYSGITINGCEDCGAIILFNSGNQFAKDGFTCFAYDYCVYRYHDDEYNDILEFEYLYSQVFWEVIGSGDSFYEFEVNNEVEISFLIITDEEGNQAFYANQDLAVDNFEKHSLVVYPNPIENQLFIENFNQPIQIIIYDVSGSQKIEKTLNSSSQSIDVSQLSAGLYF